MLHLLNNLLDISQIEAGKLVLNLEGCDIISLIRLCIEINQIMARKKGIRLNLGMVKDVTTVILDL